MSGQKRSAKQYVSKSPNPPPFTHFRKQANPFMLKKKNKPFLIRLQSFIFLSLTGLFLFSLPAEAQQARKKHKGRANLKTVYRKPARKVATHRPIVPVSNPTVVRSQAAFTFTNRWHDFGDIVQGQKITHTFAFRNTGKDPLIISNVQPTCGCTVTEWTRQPIMPGQPGGVTVTFDSGEALNGQSKTITVISNSSGGSERLYLRGNVLPKR